MESLFRARLLAREGLYRSHGTAENGDAGQVSEAQNPDFEMGCKAYIQLLHIYEKMYRPPAWANRMCAQILRTFGNSAMILYPQGVSMADVKRLSTEREPVNIAMN